MLLIFKEIHGVIFIVIVVHHHHVFVLAQSLSPCVDFPIHHHIVGVSDVWLESRQQSALQLGYLIVEVAYLLHYILRVHFDVIS